MTIALTQHELDEGRCQVPGCRHEACELTLHGRCHPSAGTFATYVKQRGVLIVRCAACSKVVAEIAVAP